MTQTSEHGSVFQSTRSARSATLLSLELEFPFPISIHALREERDRALAGETAESLISIHALREERDAKIIILPIAHQTFQSTRSARSATAAG